MLTQTTSAAAAAPVAAPDKLPAWQPAVLAVLGAVLLWLGWPVHPAVLALLLLVGWVPYLRMEQQLTAHGASGWKVWRYSYLLLVLWNLFITYWVSYSTLGGGITAVVCNALLMSAPLMAFYHTKKRFGPKLGYLSLPIYWIAFEQLHLHWFLTWPWLTLGNGFAQANQWVQWYEYTGFLGGSVWVWLVNLLVFGAWFGFRRPTPTPHPQGKASGRKVSWLWPALAAVLPIGASYLIGSQYQEKGPTAEVLVIQPNVDPFNEKFEGGANFISHDLQMQRMLTLTEQNLTPQTKLVLWPETSLDETYFESNIDTYPKIQRLRQWLSQHPGVELMTGLTTVEQYGSDKSNASPTARFREDLGYYDIFNAALHLGGATGPAEFYHKSRLVPGVEGVPPWLSAFVIDLGGTAGGLGSQPERTVYRTATPGLSVAPVICYESVYGDFVGDYVKNGASLIGIITNDGWWSDSPGHNQHLQYATLRAIETRRDIARSANTGISAFINQKGEITQRTGWWVQAASRATVHLNTELTFYVRYGELIGPACQVLAVLLLVLTIVRAVQNRKQLAA
ncbi:apolipoprotein N-acyltransferase [Hymenobacter luteus]|uniref:Apolipoprotein N-acyltransferase n=2 Tax=Hymenobacter TaxID=89966 RepID=A0A7W9WBC5_9BACT|nr:apolipoprotein N-acyltransferase [Hymenobacter latericoloratus]MBB4599411.1 apolipoprotein N-acyltransferase [Hymenobacter latericoloratus]MBB6058280.1 apolipoprotein N-acyltransferase [Hymenobacter luteus]